jgi:hypothetical protein
MSKRQSRGSVTAFGVVLALVLVTIGGGLLFFILFMGGQREIQNAVDAGALNIGKMAPDYVSVNLSAAPNQQCFLDTTSDTLDSSNGPDGKVNLHRINKVWGEGVATMIPVKNREAGCSPTPDNQSNFPLPTALYKYTSMI